MRIFVAGATGVIGSRAVAQLRRAGHDVTGIARTPEKAAQLRRAGATPVSVSLFDPDALRAAVAGHDAVVNLATKIPSLAQAARDSAWAENTRIRTEGSRNLVDAAIAAGAAVFVQESIAFMYGEHGDAWIDASDHRCRDVRVHRTGTGRGSQRRFDSPPTVDGEWCCGSACSRPPRASTPS